MASLSSTELAAFLTDLGVEVLAKEGLRVEVFETLASVAPTPAVRAAVLKVRDRISLGEPLSAALQQFDHVDEVAVSAVRASENKGFESLAHTLKQLGMFLGDPR